MNNTTRYATNSDPTTRLLPNSWNDGERLIIGFNQLSNSDLAALGWYPVRYESLNPGATGYGEMQLIGAEYVVPSLPADLANLKTQKQQERTAAVEAARESGFAFNGHTVASDIKSWLLIQGTVTIAQLALGSGSQEALDQFNTTLGSGWRAIDQTIVATDALGMIAMSQAMAYHMAVCDAVSQAHKAAIDAAETVEAVQAIDVTAGYPANA